MKKYTDLLNKKLDALNTIYKATSRVKFNATGDSEHLAEEAERYASLYEQREEIINSIKKMDEEILAIKEAHKIENAGESVINEIKSVAKAIAELDKANIKTSEKLTALLKGSLKKIRDGSNISQAYGDIDTSGSSGHYFDSAK